MPYTVRFEDNVYWTTLHGVVTNADLIDLARAATEQEAQHEVVPNRIADLGTVDELDIDFSGVEALVKERSRRHYPNEFKTALIAPDVVHFGFARMFQTLMGHSQIRVAIFPTTAEALQWLSRPDLDLPETPWVPPANSTPTPPDQ
jgi:hypothetical protein